MKPTFEKTVDILVKAYLNDTLGHGVCTACAVGNMVASALGYKIGRDRTTNCFDWIGGDGDLLFSAWDNVFCTSRSGQRKNQLAYHGEAKRQIDATGYTWQELASIEYAFETVQRCKSDDEWMFNGLMAVVDVLADIHGIDLEKKEAAKALFVKA